MSHHDFFFGLEYATTPNLQACLVEALRYDYSYIVTPILHPRFRRSSSSAGNLSAFTRTDMILSPQDWTTAIVGRLSPYLDVDSPSPAVRQRHEDCMVQELNYCHSLILPAIMLSVDGKECNNLGRIIYSFLEKFHSTSMIWVRVPLTCTQIMRECGNKTENNTSWNDTWLWWSKLHEHLEWDKRVGVVLELSAELPTEEVVLRWLGEPVKAIILPTSIFLYNKKGWPDDYIHNPLQPLAYKLDSLAYKVFEKDAKKIGLYEKAITQALTDMQKGPTQINSDNSIATVQELLKGNNADKKKKTVVIVVLGAGRGALISATLNAADKANVSVKVVAVEKNPCFADILAAKVRGVWRCRDVVVMPSDMREISLETKADIVVSELQGSWGDSTLSPECLNVIARLLKPGGISIPCYYRSYVTPISSPRLWAAAKTASSNNESKQTDKNLETMWIAYMQNKYDIGEAKVVFTFEHPTKGVIDHQGVEVTDNRQLPLTPNTRSEKLTWKVQQDDVLHGFAGYFDCTLYGKEIINIVPSKNNPGMISWFPVFIPIKTPLRVQKGEIITAAFWLRKDSHRIWYEWIVEAGRRSTSFHNTNGRSSQMLL